MSTREHPRFAVELGVRVRPAGTPPFDAITRDLSVGGICLIVGHEQHLAVGAVLTIDLQLVFDEQSVSEPLSLRARVIWCTPAEGQLQVGGRFLDVASEQQAYLAMFLRFIRGDVERSEEP